MSSYKIAIVGDVWGEQENAIKRPFVGPAGQELNRILADAGILRESCYVTNCFNLRPERNNIETLFVPRTHSEAVLELGPYAPGKYLHRDYEAEIARLISELEAVGPNLAVLAGNTATWAILRQTAISKIRGATCLSPVIPLLKCLPVYHPSAVLRQYDLRPVTVLDFIKAKTEAEYPELRRPKREIWLEPSVEDIARFKRDYIDGCKCLCFDIETADKEITCIGFAPSIDRAIVIPFVDVRREGCSFYGDEEPKAWELVSDILRGPEPKVGQNGLYDIQYLWMLYGIPVLNYAHDTMLLHHSLFPESPKGLAFLGSVYTNEGSWKEERPRGKHTIKRED